jgi:endonuclease/exonuclease/phosphatase family metal-dependent hydrolase
MTTTITANAGNASDAKVRADLLRAAALKPQAIGRQEVADRRGEDVPGYRTIQYAGPVKGHVALLVRRDANPRNVRLHQIGKRTHVGRDVAGARTNGWTAAKYILACDMTDPDTGADLTVATMHLVPSASHSKAAAALLATQAANAAAWLAAQSLPTDLMGDCNGQAGRPEFAPLRAAAEPVSAPSRKGAAIDIHWIKGGTGKATALDGYSSDHKPVVADITWAAKPAPKPHHHKPAPKPPEEPAMSGYHRADRKTQWFQDNPSLAGAPMTPNCVILHTTESMSWPSYSGGTVAPNYTARPDFTKHRLDWRQHFPDERSARALENHPGGVETNTLNVVQVELVGTCDPTHAKTWAGRRAGRDYIYWPDAPAWALREVGRFLADQAKRHGTKMVAPKPFKAYPGSYGANNGVRMTDAEWRNFYGIAGHQHVPENDHGDPGNIDIDRILGYATGQTSQPAPPAARPAAKPAPAPAPKPKLEQDTIDGARTISKRAAKHGNKHRASKWRSIWRAMLGRSK